MTPDTIQLERFAYLPTGTFGRLILPSGEFFFTAERPWRENAQMESCIPEGTYTLRKRASGVVKRSSNGAFSEGWEVTEVPDRTYIMLHPGNWPKDVQGCIAMGDTFVVMPSGDSQYGVANSKHAFSELMGLMDTKDSWKLDITVKRAIH